MNQNKDKNIKLKSQCLENKHIIPYLSIIMRSEYVYINRQLDNKYNFGKTQLLILKKLLLTNKPLNQNFFAEHYSIDKGSIARTCKKLEENEFIKRTIDPENKHQYILHLTKKGEEAGRQIQQLETKWEEIICRSYSGTRKELMDDLRNLARASREIIK